MFRGPKIVCFRVFKSWSQICRFEVSRLLGTSNVHPVKNNFKSTACWQLIEVANDIFTSCTFPAVAPLNDMEIAVLGGVDGAKNLSG